MAKEQADSTYTLESGKYHIYNEYDKVYVKYNGKVIITAKKPIEYEKDISEKIEKYNEKILNEKKEKK